MAKNNKNKDTFKDIIRTIDDDQEVEDFSEDSDVEVEVRKQHFLTL